MSFGTIHKGTLCQSCTSASGRVGGIQCEKMIYSRKYTHKKQDCTHLGFLVQFNDLDYFSCNCPMYRIVFATTSLSHSQAMLSFAGVLLKDWKNLCQFGQTLVAQARHAAAHLFLVEGQINDLGYKSKHEELKVQIGANIAENNKWITDKKEHVAVQLFCAN